MPAVTDEDVFGLDNEARLREAVIRAGYRAILQRDPEHLVAAAFKARPFSASFENSLFEIISGFLQSPEFSGIAGRPQFSPDTWVQMLIGGTLPLWIDLSDAGVSRSCLTESYEPAETRFLLNAIKPGMRFLDVGANIGWFAIQGANIVGEKGQLIAFEPRPSTFQWLKRSVQANGFSARAELHNTAVGETRGEMLIGWAENTDNPGGTWSVPNAKLEERMRDSGSVLTRVPVQTIDDVVDGRQIDIVKIDIEGAEPIALRGALKTLSASRPVILSEINPGAMRLVSETSPLDYIGALKAIGYRCRVLEESGAGPELDVETIADVSMVNVVFEPT